ncbi:hypothetical protein WAK64_18200 [Bacillus spongiae]|uniref:Isochorismatase family protein n=1 Tax=Bacillus spongiae TaxID=2683610 RepID=A0ABU8HIJ2_9BACI
MTKYYIVVTYDVCVHNNLYENMNEYPIDMSINIDQQISEFAKMNGCSFTKVI